MERDGATVARVGGLVMADFDELLRRLHAGEPDATEALYTAAYDELRRLAHARLRDGGRGTVLETTSLVHETFLRLAAQGGLQAAHRRAFFAYASQVMRSVIIDIVRERQAQRRGGDLRRLTLDTALGSELAGQDESDILHVHDALRRLAQAEPRLAQVVEMRYFGGYAEAEVADTLGLTERTVRRDWDKARRLLATMLET